MPALLTSASAPPSFSSARATSSAALSDAARSATWVITVRPSAASLFPRALRGSSSTSTSSNAALRGASSMAIACPSPLAAPVTITTRPSRSLGGGPALAIAIAPLSVCSGADRGTCKPGSSEYKIQTRRVQPSCTEGDLEARVAIWACRRRHETRRGRHGMKVTHLGHACLLVETGNARILIDPGAFSEGFAGLDHVNAVLITHKHFDHFEPAAVSALMDADPEATLIVERSTANEVPKSVDTARMQVVSPGDMFAVKG